MCSLCKVFNARENSVVIFFLISASLFTSAGEGPEFKTKKVYIEIFSLLGKTHGLDNYKSAEDRVLSGVDLAMSSSNGRASDYPPVHVCSIQANVRLKLLLDQLKLSLQKPEHS